MGRYWQKKSCWGASKMAYLPQRVCLYLDSCLVAGVLLVGEHGLGSAAVLIAAYHHVVAHGM